MTKPDGSARGGVVARAETFALPVHAIGVGALAGKLFRIEEGAAERTQDPALVTAAASSGVVDPAMGARMMGT